MSLHFDQAVMATAGRLARAASGRWMAQARIIQAGMFAVHPAAAGVPAGVRRTGPIPVRRLLQRGASSLGFGGVPNRAHSAQASTAAGEEGTKLEAKEKREVLQHVPDSRFWSEVFEGLDLDGLDRSKSREGQAEGGTVLMWAKKPREAVKKGDILFEAEFFGMLVELKAERPGFLSQRLVQEGEFLSRGQCACLILSEPEDAIELDRMAEDTLLAGSEGSVRQMEDAKDGIQRSRDSRRSALVSAANLLAVQGLSDGEGSLLVTRVPGHAPLLWVAPPALHLREVNKDVLLDLDPTLGGPDGVTLPGGAADDDARLALALAALNALPSAECVVIARPAAVTALSLIAGVHNDAAPGAALADFGPAAGPRFPAGVPLVHGYAAGGAALAGCAEEATAALAVGAHALVLQGCGVLAVGASVEEAYAVVAALERAARARLASLSAGRPLADAPQCWAAGDSAGPHAARGARRDVEHFASLVRLLKAGALPPGML